MRRITAALAAGAIVALGAATAQARAADIDYSQMARNIIPSGQYGQRPDPAGADRQAQMYDALTPLFDHVTNADLHHLLQVGAVRGRHRRPRHRRDRPVPGRHDRARPFDVPHVTATTHDGGVWAAGWIAAEDRGLLLQQARYNARVAAIDAPGLTAIGLIATCRTSSPAPRPRPCVATADARCWRRPGPEGQAVPSRHRRRSSTGSTPTWRSTARSTPPWTRNDVYALNALKDQFVGEGGGDEARRSEFLGGLEQRLGVKKGYSVFNDLRQYINAGSPTTVDGTFNYDHTPTKPGAPGSVVLDPGSFHADPVGAGGAGGPSSAAASRVRTRPTS